MKIPRNSKLATIAAKGTGRYDMTRILLDPKRKELVATDGRMLVTVPIEFQDDDVIPESSVTIDPKYLEDCRKESDKRNTKFCIQLTDNGLHFFVAGGGTRTSGFGAAENFPKYAELIEHNAPKYNAKPFAVAVPMLRKILDAIPQDYMSNVVIDVPENPEDHPMRFREFIEEEGTSRTVGYLMLMTVKII